MHRRTPLWRSRFLFGLPHLPARFCPLRNGKWLRHRMESGDASPQSIDSAISKLPPPVDSGTGTPIMY